MTLRAPSQETAVVLSLVAIEAVNEVLNVLLLRLVQASLDLVDLVLDEVNVNLLVYIAQKSRLNELIGLLKPVNRVGSGILEDLDKHHLDDRIYPENQVLLGDLLS